MEHYIDLTEIDKKYKDKCSLIKAGKCKNVNIFLENSRELKRLKAENEELTTINARLLGRLEVDETDTSLVFNLDKELRQKEKEFYTAIQKVVKLKQTLAEIKEIAEEDCKQCFEIDGFSKPDDCGICPYNKILQKISEV